MKKLTQSQYQTVFLYSKGLTFKEIDIALAIASKGVYSQVIAKDKGRIARAKISREKNKRNYQEELNIYLDETRCRNKLYKNYSQWIKDKYNIVIPIAKENFRLKYINECLNKSYSSYSKYKITFIKKYYEKVA